MTPLSSAISEEDTSPMLVVEGKEIVPFITGASRVLLESTCVSVVPTTSPGRLFPRT